LPNNSGSFATLTAIRRASLSAHSVVVVSLFLNDKQIVSMIKFFVRLVPSSDIHPRPIHAAISAAMVLAKLVGIVNVSDHVEHSGPFFNF
jgi:hypothetical protein